MTIQNLRQTINQRFSLSNIRSLCFDLGIEYEELGGGSKSDIITALIKYCQQNELLDELQSYLTGERSFVDWAELFANLPAAQLEKPAPQGGTTIHIEGDVYGLVQGNDGEIEQNFNFASKTKSDKEDSSEAKS